MYIRETAVWVARVCADMFKHRPDVSPKPRWARNKHFVLAGHGGAGACNPRTWKVEGVPDRPGHRKGLEPVRAAWDSVSQKQNKTKQILS